MTTDADIWGNVARRENPDARIRPRTCYRDGCEAPADLFSMFCSQPCAVAWDQQQKDSGKRGRIVQHGDSAQQELPEGESR